MSLLVGTTNEDGSGSAAGLTEFNDTSLNSLSSFLGDFYWSDDGEVGAATSNAAGGITLVGTTVWNKENFKEVSLDTNDQLVYVENFVDVNISNQSTTGQSVVIVEDAKRGTIDTSGVDSDDAIFIQVESNSINWGNTFEITTGEGNDYVALANGMNSQFTSYNIDLGTGDDTVDISGLYDAAYNGQVRELDGGEGFDAFVTNGSDKDVFTGFEVVVAGSAMAALNLNKDELADNNGSDEGLIVTGFDEVNVVGDLMSDGGMALSSDQADYLSDNGFAAEDFMAYTITDTLTNDEYVILSDAIDDDMPV